MDGVAFETEAHEHRFHAQHAFEVGDDGDAASATHGQRALAEGLGEALFGGAIGGQCDGTNVAFAAVHRGDFDFDAIGSQTLHIVHKHLAHFLMLLMGNQTAAHFGVGLGRQHRFRTFALVTAPHAANVETRAAGIALDGGIAFLAAQLAHADRAFIGCFVERNGSEHGPFFGRELFHIVVEAGNRDAAVAVDHLGQQFAEHQCGVGHRTAEVAGVQVAVRARHFDLPIGQTAQAGGERGEFGGEHRGVAHQNHIAAQQFAVRREESRERGTADFLFAFENELHVVAKQVVAHEIFEGFDLNERLSFVVVGTARPNVAVAHLGFERIGVPEVEGFGGHHVIVRIN